jgi:Protein of unknown function (DUF3153)
MKIRVGVEQVSGYIERCSGALRVWLLSLIDRQLAIGFCAIAIVLSGCVKYDTGVNFSSLSDGEIVEHIQLSEQLNSFSQNAANTWLKSIEQRTIAAQGHLERLSDREFKVIIPFNNPQELVTKINHYFNPTDPNPETGSQLNARMQIERSNFLLLVRNHLTYDVDLHALSVKSSNPKVSVNSANFVDLDFSLNSPWGVKNVEADGNLIGIERSSDRQMTWQLKPGQLNRIDAIFWLPNPLGVGAIAIVFISAIGYYLKYRKLPWQLEPK